MFEFEHCTRLPSDRHLTSPLAFATGTRYVIDGKRPERNGDDAFSATSPAEPTMEEFR